MQELLDIGSFSSFHNIRLRLPPTTFSHFWIASAASDGAARDITIYFKAEAELFKITRVLLVEHIAEQEKTRAPPVVAETRPMQWQGTLLGFLVCLRHWCRFRSDSPQVLAGDSIIYW